MKRINKLLLSALIILNTIPALAFTASAEDNITVSKTITTSNKDETIIFDDTYSENNINYTLVSDSITKSIEDKSVLSEIKQEYKNVSADYIFDDEIVYEGKTAKLVSSNITNENIGSFVANGEITYQPTSTMPQFANESEFEVLNTLTNEYQNETLYFDRYEITNTVWLSDVIPATIYGYNYEYFMWYDMPVKTSDALTFIENNIDLLYDEFNLKNNECRLLSVEYNGDSYTNSNGQVCRNVNVNFERSASEYVAYYTNTVDCIIHNGEATYEYETTEYEITFTAEYTPVIEAQTAETPNDDTDKAFPIVPVAVGGGITMFVVAAAVFTKYNNCKVYCNDKYVGRARIYKVSNGYYINLKKYNRKFVKLVPSKDRYSSLTAVVYGKNVPCNKSGKMFYVDLNS